MHPSVPAGNYMFKVVKYVWNMFNDSNRDSRTTPIFDKKRPEQFETDPTHYSRISIVGFEQVNAGWEVVHFLYAKKLK